MDCKTARVLGEYFTEGLSLGLSGREIPIKPINVKKLKANDAIEPMRFSLQHFAPSEAVEIDPMSKEDYIQLVEFKSEEIRKLSRERDLWESIARMFYDELKENENKSK